MDSALIICGLCYTRITCDQDTQTLDTLTKNAKLIGSSISVMPICYGCQLKILEAKISLECVTAFLQVKPVLDLLIFLYFLGLHKRPKPRKRKLGGFNYCPAVFCKFIPLNMKSLVEWCPLEGAESKCPHFRAQSLSGQCVYNPFGPEPLPYFVHDIFPFIQF